jgi:hypothetical protein
MRSGSWSLGALAHSTQVDREADSVMSDARNKALLRHAFEETAKGNGRPFVEALADVVRWTIIGSTGRVKDL